MFARPAFLAFLLLAAACGDDKGDTQSGSTTDDPGATGTTVAPTTSAGTTTSNTTSAGTDDAGGTTTTDGPTTSTDDATTAPPTTTTDPTTGDPVAFERFQLNKAAGPCPPRSDCDGFVELLADGTLRVEKFGDVGDPVTEVAIDAADLDAAIPVFTDPALIALLSGAEPICDPPTDVFEEMIIEFDGTSLGAPTTACDQPPIAAARAKATELQAKYVP